MDETINIHDSANSLAATENGDYPGQSLERVRIPGTQPRDFKLWTLDELEQEITLDWLVHEVLPDGRLALIFGPSGVYKTFLALDMALSIATGLPCLGRTTEQGPVVYISGEGQAAIGKRTKAWSRDRRVSVDPDMFRVVRDPVQLHQEQEVETLLASLEAMPRGQKLVIVDTLARSFVGGDENEAKDMGLFIAGTEAIRRATGATVLVIHHTSANQRSSRPRGHSALDGAMDTILQVTKPSDKKDGITIKCYKQKDAAEFPSIECAVQEVDVGDGQTSLVLSTIDGPGPALINPETEEYRKAREFAELVREMGNPFADEVAARQGKHPNTTNTYAQKVKALGLIRIDLVKEGRTRKNKFVALI